jgi:hypothetical protein
MINFLLFTLFTIVSSLSCSNDLPYYYDGICPNNHGTPDCQYIFNNKEAICQYVMTGWEIVTTDSCNLRGASYGCIYEDIPYDTMNIFCCDLSDPSLSSTSTLTSTRTPSPSTIYPIYDSQNDFSSTQGYNGWNYGSIINISL